MPRQGVWRAAVAGLGGAIVGCATAKTWYGLLSPSHRDLDGIGMVPVLALGAATASLVSWHHRPGLPAFAGAVALACVGTQRGVPPSEFWLVWTMDALWLMGGFLGAYAAAWAVDTQIVFRALLHRPPPKDVTPHLLLVRLIPCCILTGTGGLVVFLWGASGGPVGMAIVALAFTLSAAVSARYFPVVSTLWVTLGPLWAASVIGWVGLLGRWPMAGATQAATWRGWTCPLFVAVSVASALGGYWLARLGAAPSGPRNGGPGG